MTTIDDLLANNHAYADSHGSEPLEAPPRRRVAVVTCMDARIDPAAALGLAEGDAHVLRNAGGIVTDDVIRSLAISQRKLGTRDVMVIQHTRCGMNGLDDAEFSAELEAAAATTPTFEIGGFADLEASVRESVGRLRDCGFLPERDSVRGFVYDVDTHALREVEAG